MYENSSRGCSSWIIFLLIHSHVISISILYSVSVELITSTKEVMFSSVFVCLLVSTIMQNIQKPFASYFVEGWGQDSRKN